MSLILVTNPVVTEDGVVKNIFAGFRPVEYVFKREDLSITSVGAGLDDNIEVTIGTDLTSILSVGDFFYLYAPGDSGEYIYDLSGEITAITSTTITMDSKFIEAASSGYINYFQDYYVEVELVGEENVNRKVIPFSLKDDGDQAGNITIDVSIANDKNRQSFTLDTEPLTEGRIKFDVRYREVSEGSTGSWESLEDPIILVFAWEQMDIEEFINDFDYPKIYKGYDAGVILSHSDSNGSASFVSLTYNEYDINKTVLTTSNALAQISNSLYGLFFFLFSKSISLNSKTKYIKFTGSYVNLPDYEPIDYASPDYKTT